MSSNIYTAGLHNVGSYQVSGAPYAVSASAQVTFPYVTRWVKIINNDSSDINVGFSDNGLKGDYYFTVKAETSTEPLEMKITEIYFSSTTDVTVVAGLTNLPVARVNNLSGSGNIVGNNWSGSAGVG